LPGRRIVVAQLSVLGNSISPVLIERANALREGGIRIPSSSPLIGVGIAEIMAASLLDHTHQALQESPANITEAMDNLMAGLAKLKQDCEPAAWEHAIAYCRRHPVAQLILDDPFTRRSFRKPRGYPGDAVLIDYIYSGDCRLSEAESVSQIGQQIFEYNRDTPACKAVRARRDVVRDAIDQLCERVARPSILSVACGHLREAWMAQAVRTGRAGRFIGLDQDEMSIEVVRHELGPLGVVPVCNSIKALFRGALADETFDLIYSTGLYDYLDDRLAAKLTERLYHMLNPGGKLIVANFLPGIEGAGYMEAFMDWKLIYRTREQMLALAASLPAHSVQINSFVEENKNILFMEISRI